MAPHGHINSDPTTRRLSEKLWDLLFPPRCVACGAPGTWLCRPCITQIQFLNTLWEPAREPPGLQGLRSVAPLSGPLQKAIHAFKYEGLRVLASTLGELLCEGWKTAPQSVDVIVPVPLHPARLRERGYNQSALLVRELGLRAKLPVDEQTLERITATRPQVGLNAEERAENVRDAFSCQDDRLRDLRVLLVDDVLTTGATMRACAHALGQRDVRAVWGLTLTRG
ncbi:MAG TPA: ComF family protein [Anaerolineae bacterium]|nr:ComF family protein [Anaerolineae bacterium]